ncbi:hypothetical protein [Thorsellia anophelis]|uniref:Uncharacterized protein n=1 Tax=Thorsellia anophelis DSM 18579 TaxID=1123402 RepID=A0A1H9Z797_9GAMM|nr:hypothetical protein [Thorsellia anophelis]SES77375.1 hypothetical protein SAMN02583745_00453 [Thorsellia anophelis DSM 18579]
MNFKNLLIALLITITFSSAAQNENIRSTAQTISSCRPNILTIDKEGTIKQTICQMDTSNLIRLDTITRTKTQTIFNLTFIGGSQMTFCLWPVESKNTFRLIDMDTFETYRLKSQVTDIQECTNELDYLGEGNELSLKLVFDALPVDIKQFKLQENPYNDDMSPTVFLPVNVLAP